MPIVKLPADQALARLAEFDALIDARSPAEYALDRLPGALNWPSLNDAERALVGTEYKQVSPFAARKRGAVLVARNIAAHVEREAMDKPLAFAWYPIQGFDELFGETVSGRAVQGYMDGVSGRPGPTPYERGKGFVAAPAILAPASVAAAPISRAPSHHFHSGLLR